MQKVMNSILIVLVLALAGCEGKEKITQTTTVSSRGGVTFFKVKKSEKGSMVRFTYSEHDEIVLNPGVYQGIACTPHGSTMSHWFFSENLWAADRTPVVPECQNTTSVLFLIQIKIGENGMVTSPLPSCERLVIEFRYDPPLPEKDSHKDWRPTKLVTMSGEMLSFGKYRYYTITNSDAPSGSGRNFLIRLPDQDECLEKFTATAKYSHISSGHVVIFSKQGTRFTGLMEVDWYKEIKPGEFKFQPPTTLQKRSK